MLLYGICVSEDSYRFLRTFLPLNGLRSCYEHQSTRTPPFTLRYKLQWLVIKTAKRKPGDLKKRIGISSGAIFERFQAGHSAYVQITEQILLGHYLQCKHGRRYASWVPIDRCSLLPRLYGFEGRTNSLPYFIYRWNRWRYLVATPSAGSGRVST
jgi:hypothetical protein